MSISDDELKIVRENSIEWHCHEISIYQEDVVDGYNFSGYGIIKSADKGSLYLEFVCLETSKRVDFREDIPKNPFDEKQYLTMEGVMLSGTRVTSGNLRIKPEIENMNPDKPTIYIIHLQSVTLHETSGLGYKSNQTLHFEFKGECRIPTNKSNTTESTLGKRSFGWNQTVLTHEDKEINIIRRDGYTQVNCHFEDSNLDDLREGLLFYLGFSSGRFVQPYVVIQRNGSETNTTIYSVDDSLIYQVIPPPISDVAYDADKKSFENHHFELFSNILNIKKRDNKLFESTYSQWSRVWHSFSSYERGVLMLSLSVAVEGVLNDIFIPILSKLNKNDKFDIEKERIISSINNLSEIDNDHLDSITKYISRWGNIHPKKAIEMLVDKGLLTEKQKKCWGVLRNSSAHPKLVKVSEGRREKDYNRIITCLGLFYRLILSAYLYKGPLYAYEKIKDGRLIMSPSFDLFSIENNEI